MKIKLICVGCGIEFEREKGEWNRSNRLGKQSYCSSACVGRNNVDHLRAYNSKNVAHLIPGNRRDEYSPFREYLRRCRNRTKEITITLQDLKDQWEKQEGICPITGWKLDHASLGGKMLPNQPSVDRIDSSRGYVIGNIQYLALIAQFAKHAFPEEDVIEFCRAVVTHRGSP
jgi:hypothetical protein